MQRVFHFLIIFVIFFSGCSGFKKKFSIGVDPSFYPANLGGQADQVYGFISDLLDEIADSEGVIFYNRPLGSESILNGLEDKAYHGLITPKANILIGTNLFSLSKPIFLTGPVLVTPLQSNFNKLNQLQGKIVGVVIQSDAQFLVDRYTKIFISTYNSPSFVMAALKYNMIDGALLDVMVAQAFVNNVYQGMFKVASNPLTDEGLYLVTMKDENPLLIEIFNTGLKRIKENGSYEKLLKKWNLHPQDILKKRKSKTTQGNL